jgi:hypothetical protein
MKYLLLSILLSSSMIAQNNQWRFFDSSNSPIQMDSHYSIAEDKNNNYWIGGGALYYFDGINFTLYDSINSPVKWVSDVAVDSNGNVIIADWRRGVIIKSGESWTIHDSTNSPFPRNEVLLVTVDKFNRYWAGIPNYGIGMFHGNQWTFFNYQNSFHGIDDHNFIEQDKEGAIWIGTDYFGLYKYDGTSWIKIVHSQPGMDTSRGVTSILFDENNSIWVSVNKGGHGEVWHRSNNDTSWIKYGAADFGKNVRMGYYKGSVIDKNSIKYFGTDKGLLKYDGISWNFLDSTNSPLPAAAFMKGYVDRHNNKIFSVYTPYVHPRKYTLSFYNENGVVITSVNDPESIGLSQFTLNQNYPNPFNPSTRISFTLPVSENIIHANLKVFDLLGREVAVLVNDEKSPGTHEVIFNADNYNLSSGVYFYTLRMGNKSVTKKLLLTR